MNHRNALSAENAECLGIPANCMLQQYEIKQFLTHLPRGTLSMCCNTTFCHVFSCSLQANIYG